MRRGIEAEFPQRVVSRSSGSRTVAPGDLGAAAFGAHHSPNHPREHYSGAHSGQPHRARQAVAVDRSRAMSLETPSPRFAQNQANCARYFADLRSVLRLTPHQAADHVVTHAETIAALEAGHVWLLPPWPETARVVMAYAAMAGIDGRPVLSAIADMLQEIETSRAAGGALPPPSTGRAQHAFPVDRILRAGNAIAHTAARLPREAIAQVRQRPDRAFYAVSFPLAILLVVLNSSLLGPLEKPLSRMTAGIKGYFQVEFAPVRDGFRWIEVDDPRSRRADQLPVEHR